MTQMERDAFASDCLNHDDTLRESGVLLQALALQPAGTAASLRWRGGQVVITDGPFAETKVHLGGFMVLEAADLNQAIRLLSSHPGLRLGGWFEIRPINENITEEIGRMARRISGYTSKHSQGHNIEDKERS